jgi:uncharacterized membrane protein
MQHNQQIFESLFNRNFSDETNTGFLQELSERHPYFSPARFFLLEKLQDNAPAFETEAVKTNILFNNPHWLNFQLKQTRSVAVSTEKKFVTHMDKPLQVEVPEVDDLPDNTDEPAYDSHLQEKEIEPMHIELKMPEQKANLTEAMLFEPMHMVDYFASQGIKLSEEVQTGDKLGKQLKSFTEWLKTMKKVHVENEADISSKTDSSVQLLAENSNAEAEVLTEAMAEVFARQGKIGKASEVYQKLSLLNPAKSTYFAAKLENLKAL